MIPAHLNQKMAYGDVIQGLRALEAWDFDYGNPAMDGPERLEQLTDCLLELPERQAAVPELFELMERLHEADLGTPGPIVYALEQLDYVEALFSSVKRIPTVLSVWMISRLLKPSTAIDLREMLLDLLAQVPDHPRATYGTREDAKHLLRLHKYRGAAKE